MNYHVKVGLTCYGLGLVIGVFMGWFWFSKPGVDTTPKSCIIVPKVDKTDNATTPTKSPAPASNPQVSGEGVMRD